MKLPKPINLIANELTVYCSSIRSNEFLPWLHYSFKNHSEIYWNSNLKFEFHEIQIISDKSNYVLDYQKKKKMCLGIWTDSPKLFGTMSLWKYVIQRTMSLVTSTLFHTIDNFQHEQFWEHRNNCLLCLSSQSIFQCC